MHEVTFDGTLAGWRRAARGALAAGLPPEQVLWREHGAAQGELGLADGEAIAVTPTVAEQPGFRVPRAFLELATEVSCHRDPTRWALLYRVLWRLQQGEPHLLAVTVDADVRGLAEMAKAVRRDVHKMRAFVRFREVVSGERTWFVAWFEPQHHIVEMNARFFMERFPEMCWSILTPDRCVHWDQQQLQFSAGVDRSVAPSDDAVEDLWRTYYASIFNPARVKVNAMTAEMPRHYWKNLPEAEIIPALLARAPDRVDGMLAESARRREGAEIFREVSLPAARDLDTLRGAAASCRACPLWRNATCTVFGEGPPRARIVLVGEQPGDQEDRAGRPFVGPAGQLLDRALWEARIDRAELYLTNAVKHFKWEPRGKRRLHAKPSAREVAACRPWLEAELRALDPQLIVCLGATATQSVVGPGVQVTAARGSFVPTEFGAPALITLHPSALLRLPASKDPQEAFARYVQDLRAIHRGR